MRSVAKSFAEFLFLGSCLLLAVVVGTRADSHINCTLPPDGVWIIEHYVQVEPGNFVNRFQSILTMERAFANAYVGTTNTTDRVENVSGTVFFGAIFDLDTCILSGSLVEHQRQGVDQFRLTYNGNTMVGDYIVLVAGELLFPRFSRLEVTYQG
eukprot:g3066.t1